MEESQHLLTILCRMLQDAEAFKARLGKLDGAEALGDHLIKIISEKDVQQEATPAPSNNVLSPSAPEQKPLPPSPAAEPPSG